MVDYIVVGLGLAGIAFCEELRKNNKTFVVYDKGAEASSEVAGGLYNPVNLNRFTLAWNAAEQLDKAMPFYTLLGDTLGIKLDHKIPVLRRFASVAEQNEWFDAADKRNLEPFLSLKLVPNIHSQVKGPFGFGRVEQTGRIDISLLISTYRKFLEKEGKLNREAFDYSLLETGKVLQYKNISASTIVFAEGFGLKKNPFFNYLPLLGSKGELLTVFAPELKVDVVIKSSVFIIPLADDLYKVGATYNWNDKTFAPTTQARAELIQKLESLISCSYEVVNQEAGIRPTVKDRRPLAGKHPEHKNLFVLNGLGTRGVMVGPTMALSLYDFIEKDIPLPKETDIRRYENHL